MAFVYLLRCADGSLYCGWTTDVERRLAAHHAGRASRYTRSRRPVELAAAIPVADRSAALREEARVKRLSRSEKLALIEAAPASGRRPAPPGRARPSFTDCPEPPSSRSRSSGLWPDA